MVATMVDSNVLLDVMTEDANWLAWSAQALTIAANVGDLVINPVIYAEVSVGFDTIEALEEALSPDAFRREPVPYEAAFLAGKCFVTYRRRGGTKDAPLPDFFIGAHAAVAGLRLLTRDAAGYRSYFPRLELICP